MANPKQKRSKSNTRTRRRTWKLQAFSLSTCPQCKKPRRPHYACQNCGYYDGRLAIKQKDEPQAPRTKG
ncbi:MAG TPA: 50S ribosomal protein L32 [Candidatus Eremiobacteraceae bacterium]|nr:50S ribosomal protein L32 [Candidatus Eremiobacteraceae bacterium]